MNFFTQMIQNYELQTVGTTTPIKGSSALLAGFGLSGLSANTNAAASNSSVNFQNYLAANTPTTLPQPPANPSDPQQMAQYNQQMLKYINQMQATNSLRLQQVLLQVQQQTLSNQTTTATSAAAPASSTSTASQSLLLS